MKNRNSRSPRGDQGPGHRTTAELRKTKRLRHCRVIAMEFCLILRMTCRCCNLLFAEGEFAMGLNRLSTKSRDDDDDDGQPFPILLAHVLWVYHEVDSNKNVFFLLPLRPWPSHLSLQYLIGFKSQLWEMSAVCEPPLNRW